MDVVRSLADRIIVLHNGTLVADGEPAEVIASPIVQEAYLGGSARMPLSRCSRSPAFNTHVGPYHILQGVDLTVPGGGITVLLGRNGAGKTTTLRTIMGLWHASHGEIASTATRSTRSARPTSRAPASPTCRRTWASSPTSRCARTCVLAARDGDIDQRASTGSSAFPAAEEILVVRAGMLSGGQKQMLSIARAIIEPRKLILIDEPTKGLAPAIIGP